MKEMKIEHSDLLHEFLTFWFETRINGKLMYETFLDLKEMTWETKNIENPGSSILSGRIENTSNEKAEEQRIRDLVTHYLQNT